MRKLSDKEVRKTLALMRPLPRRRWELRFKGKTSKQIAQIEEVTVQAVTRSLNRGIEQVRAIACKFS